MSIIFQTFVSQREIDCKSGMDNIIRLYFITEHWCEVIHWPPKNTDTVTLVRQNIKLAIFTLTQSVYIRIFTIWWTGRTFWFACGLSWWIEIHSRCCKYTCSVAQC